VETKEEKVKADEQISEPVVEKRTPSEAKDMVKVKVLVGTLQFEDGVFSKGSIITVSKDRLKQFDPRDIQILKK